MFKRFKNSLMNDFNFITMTILIIDVQKDGEGGWSFIFSEEKISDLFHVFAVSPEISFSILQGSLQIVSGRPEVKVHPKKHQATYPKSKKKYSCNN